MPSPLLPAVPVTGTVTATTVVVPGRRDARLASLLALLVLVIFASFAAMWARVSPFEIGRSDFTNAYVGGTLWRTAQPALVYDEALQTSLHSALIAPDTEGNLPFLDTPPAAVLAAPVTLLPLGTAYRVWGLLQLFMVIAATLVVARAAPWPAASRSGSRRLIVLAAAAGVGTGVLLLQAQWDGINALSLGLAYSAWRNHRPGWAGAALALGAGLAKPHLALGLAVLLLFRWRRAEIVGALAATAGLALVSLMAVGTAGLRGFVIQISGSTGRFHLGEYVSATGLTGVLLGDTAAAQWLGILAGLSALAGVAWLAVRTRHRTDLLEPVLAVAVLASLFASPHVLFHDLAVLAPVMVWCAAAARREHVPDRMAQLEPATVILGAWLLVNLVIWGQVGSESAGAVVPWLWPALAGAVLWSTCGRRRGGAHGGGVRGGQVAEGSAGAAGTVPGPSPAARTGQARAASPSVRSVIRLRT